MMSKGLQCEAKGQLVSAFAHLSCSPFHHFLFLSPTVIVRVFSVVKHIWLTWIPFIVILFFFFLP